MADPIRILEDPPAILLLLRRLVSSGSKVSLQGKGSKGMLDALACDAEHFTLRMSQGEREALGLVSGENATLSLEDRTMRFEGTVTFTGLLELEGIPCGQISIARTLRRTDTHRFVSFVPEQVIPCSFSNSRGALLEGRIQGLSSEGLELALTDRKQNVQDIFHMGEEATVDIPGGGGQKFGAKTKVAYFGDAVVGLRFTDRNDKNLMEEYRRWLDGQQQAQAQQDRDAFGGTGAIARPSRPPELPPVRLLVDKDPILLVLTEKEELAKRLAEAFGRKFGLAWLNYIKGPLRPQLKPLGAAGEDWGRVRLILVHHHLKLASPLELMQQLVQVEKCPLPILSAGTQEDAELKTNRALSVGAVDYLVLEPFKILSVLKRIDDTLKLFA